MEPTTATVPRRFRWLRPIALLLVAVMASLGTVAVVAPSPAYASHSMKFCFPIYKKTIFGWYIVKWYCIDIPVEYNPDPCCIYDYGVDLAVNPVLPEDVQHGYLSRVGDGLSLLRRATLSDPRTAVVLRSRAQDSFLGAARYLGESRVALNQVGIADVANLRFEPVPLPWLESAGVDIADGLGLMQRAVADPVPQPWIKAGMEEFEAAVDQLASPSRG